MKFTLRTKLLGSYTLILSLMVIVTIVVVASTRSLMYNFSWVDHTYKVLDVASQIESAAVDMETGMRGFVIAGRDEFLEPYDSGKSRLFKLIDSLSVTVSDNPSQVTLLREIKQNMTAWDNDIVQLQIDTRRAVDNGKTMDDVVALVAQARGKKYFDKFRGQIKLFKDSFSYCIINVVTNKIHQLKRSHSKSALCFHSMIDGCKISDTFFINT